MTASGTPPAYDVAKVEAVVLEVAAELHPRNLPVRELSLRVISDIDDKREVDTVRQAIRNLHEFGLFVTRDDGSVEPTSAALHAVALLAG
jgi:hypothetical protein